MHSATVLQHEAAILISMLNPTWQHWLVYWKKAFYVITIPALTQLDSSSKSFSDVLVIGFILFFSLYLFCIIHSVLST